VEPSEWSALKGSGFGGIYLLIGTETSSEATICHCPFRRSQVSVQIKHPLWPLLRVQISLL